jgi:predicted phage baseplate assembly protein
MRQNDVEFRPKIRRVLLNTTTAIEGATVENDILGASNGRPAQTFRTTQAPVLDGQVLEVREPKAPPLKEVKVIEETEGGNAIQRVQAANGKGSEFWVRWHERSNFYGSGPRHRHYVLDRVSGRVLFGDGVRGMIPPALPGNIRMVRYRTGGGASGNVAAQTIKQLKTAVPGVQKVMNWAPADGGSDLEPNASVMERGPRRLRHRERAVTLEDFEDLAVVASREVARAKCVPLFDLTTDPDALHRKAGIVSVIVVPRSTDAQPMPGAELINRVQSFLEKSSEPLLKLTLVGPEYVRINVDVEIAVTDPDTASDVELGVKRALDRYLHPLNGGPNGRGWEFGRLPHRSDLFELIQRIRGVSHVRQLRMYAEPDRPGAEKTGRFLICCGFHTVITTLEE